MWALHLKIVCASVALMGREVDMVHVCKTTITFYFICLIVFVVAHKQNSVVCTCCLLCLCCAPLPPHWLDHLLREK